MCEGSQSATMRGGKATRVQYSSLRVQSSYTARPEMQLHASIHQSLGWLSADAKCLLYSVVIQLCAIMQHQIAHSSPMRNGSEQYSILVVQLHIEDLHRHTCGSPYRRLQTPDTVYQLSQLSVSCSDSRRCHVAHLGTTSMTAVLVNAMHDCNVQRPWHQ